MEFGCFTAETLKSISKRKCVVNIDLSSQQRSGFTAMHLNLFLTRKPVNYSNIY